MAHLGIDEKNLKSVHHFVKVMNGQEQGRVLEVVEHQSTEATKQALESLNQKQKETVKTFSMDMGNTLPARFWCCYKMLS